MRDFDFTGFTFNGKHSSELGITRVSSGDRYEENLHPDIEDRTAEVPGLDGSYFFGSNYKARNINIEIAFDHLTESGLRELKKVFDPRYNGELIFDEHPYKKYIAKLESPIELSYICFDERERTEGAKRDGVRRDRSEGANNTWEQVTPWEYTTNIERIYKGEGKINFICYFPFAKSVYKYLPSEEENSKWAASSGLLTGAEFENFNVYDQESGTINIYNGGDIETGFRLYIPANFAMSGVTLTYKEDGESESAHLVLKPISLKEGKNGITDIGILIDTTNEMIMGVSAFSPMDETIITSGNIYNGYISAGYFFKFQPSINKEVRSILEVGYMSDVRIYYDYLYF